MISTKFTLEELKQLEKAKWYKSAFFLGYNCPDLEITYSNDTLHNVWYYRTGDHMFKWEQPITSASEIVEHLQKIASHREVVPSD